MTCRTGCPTQDHASWGECARDSDFRVAYCQSHNQKDATAENKWQKELDLYASARKQGIYPDGTRTHEVQAALDISDKTGKAYDGRSPA